MIPPETEAERLAVRAKAGGRYRKRPKRTDAERFAAKVAAPDPVTGCTRWLAYTSANGYGIFQGVKAHRWSWEHHHARSIPAGHQVHHVCGTRAYKRPAPAGPDAR